MKRLAICLALMMLSAGCQFHRSGSQAIEFNPLAWGKSNEAAVRPLDGWGYENGVPLDQR